MAVPFTSSATTKTSEVAGSMTGVDVMPTFGVMSPHGNIPDGTGEPTVVDQAIEPVAACSA